jgi:hypothetical protein
LGFEKTEPYTETIQTSGRFFRQIAGCISDESIGQD